VPNVVVPHVGDQRYWGDRLHRLGVAPKPQPFGDLTTESLVAAVGLARTDTAMRQRAAELGRRVRADDGIGAAVARIQQGAETAPGGGTARAHR
jgi:UDP:flavonoid glycosyltransferase YjiC (YdhE family)